MYFALTSHTYVLLTISVSTGLSLAREVKFTQLPSALGRLAVLRRRCTLLSILIQAQLKHTSSVNNAVPN